MLVDCLLIALAVVILWQCADWFVQGAVGLAERLHVPPMLVGLTLVSVATTSPELMTSFLAAIQGMPELALGNAVGSVVVDASVALGLGAVLASTPLVVNAPIFRTSAVMLLTVIGLAFLATLDGTLGRIEGGLLVVLYVVYAAISYIQVKRRRARGETDGEEANKELGAIGAHLAGMSLSRVLLLFGGGSLGVLLGSELLVMGAEGVARELGLSPIVIGLTVAAIGTSTPEVATCVIAARRGQSGLGVGNIIGADILNICWVAGLSSLATPLTAEKKVIYFMFPAALVIVVAMLSMLRYRHNLTRLNGVVLLSLFTAYLLILLLCFSGNGGVGV